MDYQKLCIELFGTDSPEELRKIAKSIKMNKNPRGAGRKKKLSVKQIADIQCRIKDGDRLTEIAKDYETSVQVLGRYLKEPMHEGCTMRIEYMFRNKVCSIIDVDFKNERIYTQNRTNVLIHRAFGVKENPDWKDFNWFIKDRCFEEGRADLKNILKKIGLESYDPLTMAECVKGRTAEDNMWMRFSYRSIANEYS